MVLLEPDERAARNEFPLAIDDEEPMNDGAGLPPRAVAVAGRVHFTVQTAAYARSVGVGVLCGYVVAIKPDGLPEFPTHVGDTETLAAVLSLMRPRAVRILALPGEATTELSSLIRSVAPRRSIWTWLRDFLKG